MADHRNGKHRHAMDDLALVFPHLPAPFSYGSPWPKTWLMSATAAKGDQVHVADLRGWGYLTGTGQGALGLSEAEGIAVQDAMGRVMAAALNEYFDRHGKSARSPRRDPQAEEGR